MSLKDFLTPKEKEISKIKSSGYDFIATNKRVIKYKKKHGGEIFEDLTYKSINSISLSGGINWALIILGIFLIFLSFPFTKFFAIFMLILFSGLVCIIIGMITRSVYRFYSPGVRPSHWTISNTKSKESSEFIKTVREHMGIEKE